MAQHRMSGAPTRRLRLGGSRLWMAAAVGTLGLLAITLVGLFGRSVGPPQPPSLVAPEPGVPTVASPSGDGESPTGSGTPSGGETGEPSHPAATTKRPSPTLPAPGDTARARGTSPTATATGGVQVEGEAAGQSQVLGRGDQGAQVLDLQQRLRKAGIDTAPLNGVYDQPTEAAVQNYQALRHIRTDPQGVYGSATRQSLESET